MRVMMTLLLGLYLVVPARAADGGPVLLLPGLSGPTAEAAPGYRCADFLEEAGLRPEGLEYLFCRPATEPRTGRRTLTARYRVPGPQAAAVETALRERTGMAALERRMGIWQLPEGGEGRFVLRQSAGEGRPGGQMAGTFFSVQGLRDGLSGDGTTGSDAGTLPSAGALSLRRRMTGWPEMPEASRREARPLYRVPQLRRGRRPLRTALQRRGRPAR